MKATNNRWKTYKGATRPQTLDPSDYGKGSRRRTGQGFYEDEIKHTCCFTRYTPGQAYSCPRCGRTKEDSNEAIES